ncbi:uncharacterized protein VP01_5677g1 [Puccinia sorghi]|uniref:Uncharacterized protein n=1 Tax=Puccinia sorghi TaxID=27349 RepID=A0A0L6UIS8_9BASI|nr:uncharacterized protein VP01_5677g1 [Puccinia sorghi]
MNSVSADPPCPALCLRNTPPFCLEPATPGGFTKNQDPTSPQIVPAPPPTSSPKSMVLAKPQPFNGACGNVAESFFGQILLHTVTYPEHFPTNSRKVDFSVPFMTDYGATWSQPYLMKVFKAEEVALNKFLDDFKSSFFDHNRQNHAD